MPIPIRLPAIAADFEAGTLSAWHKAEGDTVEKGDVIVDIETDKAVVEVEASDSGILGRILVPAGSDDVAVDSVIAVLLKDGESVDDIGDFDSAPPDDKAAPPAAETPAAAPQATTAVETPTPIATGGRLFASPLARRIAFQRNLDLSTICGSGPNGRILKADVERAGAQSPATAVPSRQGYTTVPNNNIRKVIARRLTEAKQQIPHFYLTVDCELDSLLDMRRQINEHHLNKDSGVKVSVNDCIIKAAALALRDVPAANSSWAEDAIRLYSDVDVAVAVATENGLITPVVRQADRKSLDDISVEVKDLAGRANQGRLHPDEFKGGGFTISNLGMYGIKEFSAIINPPQSCILALGAGEKRPVVRGDSLAVATVMSCTLSVDHRSVDGAVGAEFLQAFTQYLEKPALLIMG